MQIVKEQHPAFLKFAERELEVRFNPMDVATVGVVDDDRIVAVIVFSRWTTFNVELSIATDGSRRWFSRRLAEFVFKYVFDQCKKARLTTVADAWVPEAIELNSRLFKEEGHLTDWFGPGHDGILFGMTARDWRSGKYRERKHEALAA